MTETACASRVVVIFDLETTGLHSTSEIISLAAVEESSGKSFYRDARPRRMPISKRITQITGITNARLSTKPPWSVIGRLFWDWIAGLCTERSTLVLVGHNARKFDVPVLLRCSAELKRTAPVSVRSLLVLDTLAVSRRRFAGRVANHKQATIYAHIFGSEPALQHNAMGDVDALRQIVKSDAFQFEDAQRGAYDASVVHGEELRKCVAVLRARAESFREFLQPHIPVVVDTVISTETVPSQRTCHQCKRVHSVYFTHACV
ncbi:hypothetical protein CYMTET_40944 [Cymbomonas tetramitiformis]|uniref:Exonuclease domain-containing protein n=1 Tax=Cymbomonas tetramitiformis TaxID=36881 RepID=A0AAE0C8G5_9CHLO|nr:hypothetical protein CYMTET_40944 [Cymbomonas tetramitiformis]|eukprot:gene240-422_t